MCQENDGQDIDAFAGWHDTEPTKNTFVDLKDVTVFTIKTLFLQRTKLPLFVFLILYCLSNLLLLIKQLSSLSVYALTIYCSYILSLAAKTVHFNMSLKI